MIYEILEYVAEVFGAIILLSIYLNWVETWDNKDNE